MNKKSAMPPAEADAQEERQARRLHWRRVRYRLTGAAATFLLVGVLWYLGGTSTPPEVLPAPLPTAALPTVEESPELLTAGQRLEEVEDFPEIDDTSAEEYTDSADTAAEAVESAAVETAVVEKESAFVVQAGAFREQALAQGAAEKLRSAGFLAYVKTIELQGVPWFKVRVSGYEKRPAAELARRQLLALGYKGAFIDDTR